jgi:amino-acid N-acetyltransferase
MMENGNFFQEADATVSLLRQVSPYFLQHRDSLFVIHLDGGVVERPILQNLVRDLMLLSAVGIRIIVVFGAESLIATRFVENNITPSKVKDFTVFDANCMKHVKEVVGSIRLSIESSFSYVREGAPMRMGATAKISSGNFVLAKAKGVIDGQEMLFSGELRSLDNEGISQRLDRGEIVLVPPVGPGSSGELFNLDSRLLASEIAIKFQSHKLIFLHEEEEIFYDGSVIKQIGVKQAELALTTKQIEGELTKYLPIATRCCRKGVERVHFISYLTDGAILRELFTRDGVGTMLSDVPFDNLRSATRADIAEILELIKPMQEQGMLLGRTYDDLLKDLDDFIVIVREGIVVATAALHQHAELGQGEVACVAVHHDYRGDEFGDMLLGELELRAHIKSLKNLFVLTTHAADWFEERGYSLGAKADLPEVRRETYSDERNSTVLIKSISN